MKNRKTWRIVIIVLLVCSAILAFGPCTGASTLSISFERSDGVQPFFSPVTFLVISVVEICMVFGSNKALRVLGIVLQIVKNAVMPVIFVYFDNLLGNMGINPRGTVSYSLTLLSYVLFFLGVIVTVLYFIDLFTKDDSFNLDEYSNNLETEDNPEEGIN